MSGSALILQADALRLPLPDESVDLIVSSPPYFALRSYRDGDEHYAGQLGSEPTPQAFLEALWAVMGECWRVLKPSGSCFINLGDKRSGSGGHNNSGISSKSTLSGNGHTGGVGKAGPQKIKATLRNAPDRYNQAAFGRPKSKMLLPHRFAIGCEDGLADPEGKGWVVRSDLVWQKLNGLPESVTDRCRDSHEYPGMTPSHDWMTGVPCKEAPELFFSYDLAKQERAAGICLTGCPRLTECKAWALHHGDIDDKGRAVHGVIAGVKPPERKPAAKQGMRACELASCGRFYMGNGQRRYCSDVCFRASRAATRRADYRQRGMAS